MLSNPPNPPPPPPCVLPGLLLALVPAAGVGVDRRVLDRRHRHDRRHRLEEVEGREAARPRRALVAEGVGHVDLERSLPEDEVGTQQRGWTTLTQSLYDGSGFADCSTRAEDTMSETAAALLDLLLKLSEAERLMIADRLWESLSDAKQQELLDETTHDPEFQAELERRLKEVEEHPERLIDGEQALAEIRAELERRQMERSKRSTS